MTRIHHRLPYPLLVFAVAGSLLLPGQSAYAGCQINIYVKNTGNAPLTVYNKWTHTPSRESSVKIKLGTWRGLYTGAWWPGWSGLGSAPPERFDLNPGQKDGDNYDATFNWEPSAATRSLTSAPPASMPIDRSRSTTRPRQVGRRSRV